MVAKNQKNLPSIMSIRELIDQAFGEPNVNVVHHKLIHTILLILARQLRLLERRVEIEIPNSYYAYASDSKLSITEVKLHANVPKKKKGKAVAGASGAGQKGSGYMEGTGPGGGPGRGEGPGQGGGFGQGRGTRQSGGFGQAGGIGQGGGTGQGGATGQGGVTGQGGGTGHGGGTGATKSRSGVQQGTVSGSSAYDKSSSSATKTSTDDKTSSSATKSTTATSDKDSTDKSSSGITSSATKSTTEKSSSDKTSSDKSGSGKTSTEKSSSGKTSTEKSSSGKASTDKTSSDKASTEKSSSGKTSTEKSSSGKTSTEKSSSGKTSTEKTSSDKTTTDKTSSEKTSTEKTSSIKSGSSSATKSVTDETKSSTDATKSSSSKKTTSDETKSSSGKTSSKSTSKSTTKTSTEPSSTDKTSTEKSSKEKSSTTTSKESAERQYEKLLIVERVPSGGTKATEGRSQARSREITTPLSVVNLEEFVKLLAEVRQLQDVYQIKTAPGIPENTQLMKDFRKGAVMTDPVLALQLSARVDAVEKAMEKMLPIIIELVNSIYVESKTPRVNFADLMGKMSEGGIEEVLKKSEGILKEIARQSALVKEAASKTAMREAVSNVAMMKEAASKAAMKEAASKASLKEAESKAAASKQAAKSKKSTASTRKESLTALSITSKLPLETQVTSPEPEPPEPEEVKEIDFVPYEELENVLQELYDECLRMVNTSTTRSNFNANKAIKIAGGLEGRLDESLNLGDRMFDVEKLVSDYADKINILDTGLSSQMTYYQEELTHMQHSLETGLEAMAEALANIGGDTAAVAELNNQFTNLQFDLDVAGMRQKELMNIQNALSFDLEELRKKIEILKADKSDRDEVADALKDKAGLGALNGLVSRQEFDAVRGDFEKRIGSAYDKFNNQEITWQKAIDDLIRELNEKADLIQVLSLQESIDWYVERYGARIRAMEEIVGDLRMTTVSKKLHREVNCLSCSTPAHLELDQYKTGASSPEFPPSRPPGVGAAKPKEDGDHAGICYPGLPVPHEVDPRAHVCNRYCGGSHTVTNTTLIRAPVGMIINPALRPVNTAVGTDGRLYAVDKEHAKKPCIPCNYKKTTTPEPSEAGQAPNPEDLDLAPDMATVDVQEPLIQAARSSDTASGIEEPPPAPLMEEDA